MAWSDDRTLRVAWLRVPDTMARIYETEELLEVETYLVP
jgi:hypothetical protein